jgi:hypothetical protein
VFTSGYVSNQTGIATIAKLLPEPIRHRTGDWQCGYFVSASLTALLPSNRSALSAGTQRRGGIGITSSPIWESLTWTQSQDHSRPNSLH